MNFIADLHIHSRFSRATSKALNPRHLAAWARCKGINVLGTGDFTHPQWRAELAEQMVLDEHTGLYRLAGEPETLDVMGASAGPGLMESPAPLFVLQTEISSIYKRGGKVRKVHNLVFVPTLEDAERLSLRLAQIGNLNADGRPILGLDSRDLLEIMLECAPGSVMIPAHVWTPWFALFGSKSGFDRLEDCYGDLSEHIFALETGLSSDPAMNRLISNLDGYALVSNSDAHSGANLGREANLFAGRPSYAGMFAALRATARREDQSSLDCRFVGTMEFYPDEGKYHLDGHRACNVVLEPKDSLALGNICPVCGKPLTVGVLHRVLELADRETTPELPREPEVRPLIPLAEVVGEILGVGPASRRVQERYASLLRELGPELDILCRLPEADIRAHWEPLGEAVARMRRGQVYREGGYDGEYGTVRVFSPEELADARGTLPGVKAPAKRGRKKAASMEQASAMGAATARANPDAAPEAAPDTSSVRVRRASLPLVDSAATGAAANFSAVKSAGRAQSPAQIFAYSAEQQAALAAGPAPVLVLAGPGAGKTRVLVGRLQWLAGQGADMRRVLAVTFTRRAADELRQRLAGAFAGAEQRPLPQCDTLHGMAWAALRASCADNPPLLLGDDAARNLFFLANPGLDSREARKLWDALALARESGTLTSEPAQGPLARAAANYAQRKNQGQRYVDYADLLDWWLEHSRTLPQDLKPLHVLVDEVQDLSVVQLAIVRALLPEDGTGFFGIGDPDQAIYGFRGVTGQSEQSLRTCWAGLSVFRLGQSFRSSQSVLDMARSLLLRKGQCGPLLAAQDITAELRLFSAPDEHSEARWVADRVRHLLGATAHTLMDHSRGDDLHGLAGALAPGDIAVLVRLKAQIPPLRAALEQAGIPCAAPSQDGFWQDAACARLLALLGVHCGFAQLPGEVQDQADKLPESWTTAVGLPAPERMLPWLAEQPWAGEVFTGSRPWRELCRLWSQSGNWTGFFEQLAWLREAELVREKAERVQILTLHASKGLEFQAVFLPGLEDGLLPLRREILFPGAECASSNGEVANEAEERRLLYVGLTRAARALFLSHCAQRTLYGRTLHLQPSPFMTQIREFCRHSTLAARTRKEQKQIRLL